MSTARAEWVNAPTEMKSTPVSAMMRAEASDTPAGLRLRPPAHKLNRRAQLCRGHVVEQDDVIAPSTASWAWSSVSAELDFELGELRARCTAAAIGSASHRRVRRGGCP